MISALPDPRLANSSANGYCVIKPATKTAIRGKPYATLKKTHQSEAMGKVFQYEAVVPPKGGPKKEFSREVDKLVPIAHTSALNLFKAAKSTRKGDM